MGTNVGPASTAPRRGRRPTWVPLAGAVAAGALVLLAGTVPLPVFVLSPGSAVPVTERVAFTDHPQDQLHGQLLLTSVTVRRPTAVGVLWAWLDPGSDVVDRDRILPPDVDAEAYFDAQQQVFDDEAGQVAAALGLQAAGLDARVSGDGAEVIAVAPDAPAHGELRPGDVITGVDGDPVRVASDLISALTARRAGDRVTLTVRRGQDDLRPQVRLNQIDPAGTVGLGAAVRTVNRDIALPFDVTIDARGIGGPSAGLMIALGVYDLTHEVDLTHRRVVAGTGTITPSGRIGPVGGLPQKVAAAIDAGAQVFLAPPQVAEVARAAAEDRLEVIEVATLDEAIRALGDADAELHTPDPATRP